MKKLIFYFVSGTMITATACNSTDPTTTADTTTMETSETVTAAGSTTDPATTDTDMTGTTETGTTGTTTDAGMNADMTGEMSALTNLDDPTFMMAAASSNMFEIELGKMVAEKAADPQVKEFAQMMVNHHTKASQELKSIASQMNVTLPKTLMPMHQTMIDKLSGKTGAELDEGYMDTMERAHKMDIAMFEAKSNNANSPSVKTYASKTLPVLKHHQEMATEIEDTVD